MSEMAALTSSHVESEMALLAQHQSELNDVHATHSLAAQQNMEALSASITVWRVYCIVNVPDLLASNQFI